MKPTTEWMSENFDKFNRAYFRGKLSLPTFSTRCNANYFGFFKPNGTTNRLTGKYTPNGPGTLILNGGYDRVEKDWEGTLLHEMIHMYIYEVDLVEPRNLHGKEFIKWANYLNQIDSGWNISESNEKKETDIHDSEKIGGYKEGSYKYPSGNFKTHILCFLSQPKDQQFKMWLFKADYNKFNEYIETCKKLKDINGAEYIDVYHCYSDEIELMPIADPQILNGIGDGGFYRLLFDLQQKYGATLGKRNLRFFKKITL